MSKRFIPVLFVLILLAGCSANKELPQNTENTFSSVSNTSEVQQDEKSTDEPCATETESITSSIETEVIAESTESREVEDTEPTFTSGSNQKKETVLEAADSKPAKTSEQMPTQPKTETVETEKEPTNTQPVEQPDENATQPTEPEPQISEKTETTEPTESFDIDYWIDFARSYAQSIGLCLDTAAVDCWDNPIRAGSHCIYLERDIQSRLNRYAKDEDITDVWIWFEPVGNDCYDIYIGYATTTENKEEKAECLRNVLKVDEGNVVALREMVFTDLARNLPTEEIVNDFEHLLKYTTSIDEEVCSCLEWLKQYASYKEHGAFTRQVLRYFTGELSTLRDLIRDVSYQLLKFGATQDVDYLLTVLLKLNPNDADAYWAACLMKLGVSSEDEIAKSRVSLQSVPEFNKYLSLVDAARRKACLQLLDTQKYNIHREKCALAQMLICDGTHFLNIHTLHIFGTDEHRLSQLRIKRQWKTRKWGMHMVQTVDDTLWFENKSNKAYYPIEKVYPLKIVNPADVTDALAFSVVNGDYGSDSIDSRAYILVLAKKDGTTQKISHHIDRFSRIDREDFKRCLSDYSVKNGKFLYHGVCASILENGVVQTLKKSYSSEYYSLRDDGTVAEKDYSNGTVYTRNCDEIKQAVQLFEMSYLCCAALLADGTVTAVHKNETSVCENESLESKKWYQEITKLQNIVAVSEHGNYFLKKDGSIIKINYETDGLEVTPIDGKCFDNFDTILEDYEASISKYQKEEQERQAESEKSETTPETESKDSGVRKSGQGCYVATCVYGSYDCPQVWTLRRFRDNVLAKTWYGRAFIRTYYAISPTLVKWFGHMAWFKKLWKGKLDRMVEKLNAQGVNNTPYNDYSL